MDNEPPMTAAKTEDAALEAAPGVSKSGAKYKQIYDFLRQALLDNTYPVGSKLPSENEMVEQFAASRPTIGRALAQLESESLIQRRAGSGTFVSPRVEEKRLAFGLLIPELGLTEIFEPICQGISRARLGGEHDLIWGPLFEHGAPNEIQAARLCEYYLNRSLSGVFFAPLELSEGKDVVNERIVRAFDEAGIPVVLLDRDICDYPKRSRYDLVGIDNHRAGRVVAEHLLDCGARRIVFFGRPNSAPTVKRRSLGYVEALRESVGHVADAMIVLSDPADAVAVRSLLATAKPDAIICPNDYTAAHLMTTLNALGVQIPDDIRVTGMDDVKYAGLLQVPLTSIRQPCAEIGFTALMAMHDRVAHPTLPARDLFVDFELIVRASSRPAGANLENGRNGGRSSAGDC
jgi:DNA-binding LacI/PurR family transcriptional regulator